MNSFGPMGAMLQGAQQGSAEAQSILPNVYQPQGRGVPQNPFQGSLDSMVDNLLSMAKQVRDQGDKFRAEGEDIYQIALKLSKVNARLTDIAKGDSE